MLSLHECQSIIERRLNNLSLPASPAHLYEPIRYMLALGGKRVRPSLVILGCNIFSEDIEKAIYPALAIEVFHNFTLMHDDIMDNSERRRNHPSVHIRWNRNIAILSGDAMLIKAYELLAMSSPGDLHRILPVFNKTALQVCEGQQYDMDYEQNTAVTIGEYMSMVECKTAVLLAASLKIGALLGGADDKESELLFEFGRNIGIAFQLQDDLLDVFADPTVFGKDTGNDIVSNKKTILLTEALSLATGKTRENLMHWLAVTEFNRKEKIEAVKAIYTTLELEQSINKRIRYYHEKAVASLDNLPVESANKSALLAFSNMLIHRNK
jgi:geranylgeranyl diphosphate synthase, type II